MQCYFQFYVLERRKLLEILFNCTLFKKNNAWFSRYFENLIHCPLALILQKGLFQNNGQSKFEVRTSLPNNI